MSQGTILIVEDELDILNLLRYNFEHDGFETRTARDGDEAMQVLQSAEPPDLVLLDLMLPGLSGLDICKKIKSTPSTKHIPVVMLTAKGEEEDRISGFELGADDYVVKPFSPKELILRVKAVLRRSRQLEESGEWEQGGLRVEFDSFRVLIDGDEALLTATEFNLLSSLIKASGRVLTREQLLDQVWGYEFVGYARTVDTHMHRLRQKLGPYADWLETVRGIGYRLKRQ
jgi:two-component system phosphate regulon response regulator PhoB